MEFKGHEESGVFILDTPTNINLVDFVKEYPHSILILNSDYDLEDTEGVLYGYTVQRGFIPHIKNIIDRINIRENKCIGINLGVGNERYEMCN